MSPSSIWCFQIWTSSIAGSGSLALWALAFLLQVLTHLGWRVSILHAPKRLSFLITWPSHRVIQASVLCKAKNPPQPPYSCLTFNIIYSACTLSFHTPRLTRPHSSNILSTSPPCTFLWQQDLDCPLFGFLINENDLDSARFWFIDWCEWWPVVSGSSPPSRVGQFMRQFGHLTVRTTSTS